MLTVKSSYEAKKIITENFDCKTKTEAAGLFDSAGRVLAEDIVSDQFIPYFDRSTMDGYALKASDTFGCSESIPAILVLKGKIKMGEPAPCDIKAGECLYIPTGGAVPKGADAVVMIENSEDFGDKTIGINKTAAPGMNVVKRGDDIKPGDILLKKGRLLTSADIASLAAMGITEIPVMKRPVAGIISTGDELIKPEEEQKPGQIRNVNSALLAAAVAEAGGSFKDYGIIRDDFESIENALLKAAEECDLVLISGGSSAGEKDNTSRIIEKNGQLLFHGIAIKPGKPTMLGRIKGKAVFGIAGHPGAVFFISTVFVKPYIRQMMGQTEGSLRPACTAVLSEAVESNNGRTQYIALKLHYEGAELIAEPIISKSGLITSLAGIDAYTVIERDCEGLAKGSRIEVYDVI